MKKLSVYLPLAVIAVAVIFFAVGFFFGYKTKVNDTSTDVVISNSSSTTNTTVASLSPEVKPEVQSLSVTDVFWIKVGTNPVCPETHPIKGKFDSSTAKFYYTTDNKSYDRVRPDICFTTENFAKDIAGFVKKF